MHTHTQTVAQRLDEVAGSLEKSLESPSTFASTATKAITDLKEIATHASGEIKRSIETAIGCLNQIALYPEGAAGFITLAVGALSLAGLLSL